MWMKNSAGNPDAMLTFASIAFSVVTLNLFLSAFDPMTIHGHTFHMTPFSDQSMMTYLGITFTSYVGRRWTDKKVSESQEPKEEDTTPPSFK